MVGYCRKKGRAIDERKVCRYCFKVKCKWLVLQPERRRKNETNKNKIWLDR